MIQSDWHRDFLGHLFSTDEELQGFFDRVTVEHPFIQLLLCDVMNKVAGADKALIPYLRRQQDISLTKYLHGFNVTDIAKDIPYLRGEVDAVQQAVEAGEAPERIAEELADVAIYCYGMAQIIGMDLDKAIFSKMETNKHRKYPTDIMEL